MPTVPSTAPAFCWRGQAGLALGARVQPAPSGSQLICPHLGPLQPLLPSHCPAAAAGHPPVHRVTGSWNEAQGR